MSMRISFVWVATLLCVVQGFNIVITGPGALEVQLIAAKLATRAGDKCFIISPKDESNLERRRALMYGKTKEGDNSDENIGPSLVTDGDSIGDALERADGLIIACEGEAVEDSWMKVLLENASDNLKHVALLSKMGGGLKQMEDSLRKMTESAGIALSIVRAGILKGGGPGEPPEGTEDYGLHKYYYDTIFELQTALGTMSFDRFTLGAKVVPGDPYKYPNFFQKMASAQSFEPSNTDTGRIAAASALLTAMKRTEGVDISLSTAKSKVPPTLQEWETLIDC